MKFSVIIPTYNEEASLRFCVERIRQLDNDVEIIVADGGSYDNTVALAQELGVTLCRTDKGRGRQYNTAVTLAHGDVLLFLHADTLLPENAFELLQQYFNDASVNVGTFRLSFDVNHWLLNTYSWFTRFDSVFTRFGDQCIVVRKSFFEALGGFADLPIIEDVEFLQRARKRTTIYSFPAAVVTSARRFLRNGIVRQQLRNGFYLLLYFLGVSSASLARRYEKKSPSTPDAALIIFARYPRSGVVKTRLASHRGAEWATEFYRSCAEHIFDEAKKLPTAIAKFIFCSEPEYIDKMKQWAGASFTYVQQTGDDLGKRMHNAFATIFQNGIQKAIIIGTDIPDLSSDILRQAFSKLETDDIVIGPSSDGGYYLVGMKRLYSELFTDIPWSTEHVFEKTLKKINEKDCSVAFLPELMDIDTQEDVEQWIRRAALHHPVSTFIRNNSSLSTPAIA